MATFQAIKDPLAVLDWAFNWCAADGTNELCDGWLDGDTIVSSVWAITKEPDNTLIIDADVIADFIDCNQQVISTNTVTRVYLSGGTVHKSARYIVDNHITTSSGREDSRSISFEIKDR